MLMLSFIIAAVLSTTGLTISDPVDGVTYDGDWLTVRAIVENENELPDSVHYTLNGEPVIQIPRLDTDWPTYMQNQVRNGYSESPGPTDTSILWTAPVTSTNHTFQSCVVQDEVVYYCVDSLYAFEAVTGEVLWSHPLIGGGDDAPAIHVGKLFWAADSVYCFDLNTRELLWKVGHGYSFTSNPVLYSNMVLHAYRSSGPVPKELGIRCLNANI